MLAHLADQQLLSVVSDTTTINSVSAVLLAIQPPVAPKPLSTVPEIARWPGAVIPLELLHLLGVAFTPIVPAGLFELSSRWAI